MDIHNPNVVGTLTGGGGGGGSDTPWTEDHDPAGYALETVGPSDGNSEGIRIETGTPSAGHFSAGDIDIIGGDSSPSSYYGHGGDINITGGEAHGGYGYGGHIILTAGEGDSDVGKGGNIELKSGGLLNDPVSGTSHVWIESAVSHKGLGSKIVLESSNYNGGGFITITAGDGLDDGPGGDITLTSGAKNGAGVDGSLSLEGQKFPKAAGTAGWVLKTNGTDCYWAAP